MQFVGGRTSGSTAGADSLPEQSNHPRSPDSAGPFSSGGLYPPDTNIHLYERQGKTPDCLADKK